MNHQAELKACKERITHLEGQLAHLIQLIQSRVPEPPKTLSQMQREHDEERERALRRFDEGDRYRNKGGKL